MTTMAVLLLLASTIVVAVDPAQQHIAYASVKTFDKKKAVNGDQAVNPQLAADGRNVYVVWASSPVDQGEIFFKRSTNRGEDFKDEKKLSENAGGASNARIAVYGDNVYVVWQDTGTGGATDIFFKRSTNEGKSFGGIKNLSDNPTASIEPLIAAYGDNVYVVWQDDGAILFKGSTNEGADFSGIKTLSTGNSFLPQIAAYGRNVYVVWGITIIGDEFEVSFKRSTNEGADFGSKNDLAKAKSPAAAMDDSLIRIAAYGRDVYVIWVSEGRNNEKDIFFKGSTNRGASFDNEKNLSNDPLGSEDQEIAVFGNNAYVVWENNLGNDAIFFRKIIDGGEKFGKTKDISKTKGAAENPEISASGNNVFAAWEVPKKGGNFDIYLRASNDKGDKFQPDQPRNLSKDPENSRLDFEPTKSIAVSGNNGYVAWYEDPATKIFSNRAKIN